MDLVVGSPESIYATGTTTQPHVTCDRVSGGESWEKKSEKKFKVISNHLQRKSV